MRGERMVNRGFQVIRIESERAGLAFEHNMPGGIDQIKAVGPCRVCGLGRIAEFVEHSGNLNAKLAHAGSRDSFAFLFVARACKYYLVFDVALHLPHVARVRLGDVHHEEADAVAVVVIELVESGNLPPEGRSSVAAEDERDRFPLRGERRKLYLPRLVQFGQREIGSGIAGVQCARARPQP
jgi:hypothetical protein